MRTDEAVSKLVSSLTPEDSGSRTQDKYRWQARAAARDVMALIQLDVEDRERGLSPTERGLVCERWEDWLVFGRGNFEFVSAKHLDADQGPWRMSTIFDSGGIAHLYRTHRTMNGLPDCRLVSNAALVSESSTRALKNMCLVSDEASGTPVKNLDEEEILDLEKTLAQYLMSHAKLAGLSGDDLDGFATQAHRCRPGPRLLAKVRPFLRGLSLDLELPSRRLIRWTGPEKYTRHVLERLGYPVEQARAAWEHVTGMVSERMEADGPAEGGGLADLIHRWRRGEDRRTPDEERRRITSEQARIAIERVTKRPRRYVLPSLGKPYSSKLEVKLAVGGCRPNAVINAKDKLKLWTDIRDNELDDAPGNHARLEMFTQELQTRLNDIENTPLDGSSDEEERGRTLWQQVTQIPPSELPQPPFEVNRSLLIGAAAEITDQCRFWLCEPFDALAVLEQINAQSGTNSDEDFPGTEQEHT